MKKVKLFFLWIFVFVLFSSVLYSIDINFLSGNDMVTFHSFNQHENKIAKICPYNKIHSIAIECHNQDTFIELERHNFGECGLVVLPEECSSYDLIIDYLDSDSNQTERLIEEIEIIRTKYEPDEVLNLMNWDYGFDSPVDTAIALSTLLKFNHADDYSRDILNIVNWLSSKRTENDKCFPEDGCSIRDSLKIGSWLKKYDLNPFFNRNNLPDSKMLSDLILWGNSVNNYAESSSYELILEHDGFTNCTVDIEASDDFSNYNESFSFESKYELELDIERGEISVSCEDHIDFFMYSDDEIIRYELSEDDFYFEFSSGCWAEDKQWEECDIISTIYGTFLTDEEELKEPSKEYIDSQIETDSYFGQYIKNFEKTALYIIFIEEDESMERWLKYNQNNDGSWGEGTEKYYKTPLVLLSIYYSSEDRSVEAIEKGVHWLSENYDSFLARNNVNEISLMNLALMKLSPLTLNTKEDIFISNDSISFIEINNPTLYELNGTISSPNYLNHQSDFSIDPKSSYEINFTLEENLSVKNYFSIIDFKIENYSVGVPLFVNQTPSINFYSPVEDVTSSNYENWININKTRGEFDCEFFKDDGVRKETFDTQGGFRVSGRLEETNEDITTEINDSFDYKCTSEDGTVFNGTVSNIVRYVPENPFDVSEDLIEIREHHQGVELSLKNNLNEVIVISSEFSVNDPYLRLIQEEVQVPPNEEVDLEFIETYPQDEELNWSNILLFSSYNHEEEVDILIDLEESESIFSLFFKIFIFWVLVIAIYFNRKKLISILKGHDSPINFFKNLFSKEKSIFDPEKEKDIIENMINMINLMDEMGKNKQQIIYDLKDKGFDDEEIHYAIEKSNFSSNNEENDDEKDSKEDK